MPLGATDLYPSRLLALCIGLVDPGNARRPKKRKRSKLDLGSGEDQERIGVTVPAMDSDAAASIAVIAQEHMRRMAAGCRAGGRGRFG